MQTQEYSRRNRAGKDLEAGRVLDRMEEEKENQSPSGRWVVGKVDDEGTGVTSIRPQRVQTPGTGG